MNEQEYTIERLHEEAMELAQLALLYNQQAADLEFEAAKRLLPIPENEPTRGILYRSAATLYLRANDPYASKRCANDGLSGFPNKRTAFELRQVLNLAVADIKERE